MSTGGGDGPFEGRIIAGKLRLDVRLASGAMGEVWRARHLGLDKDVAVKFLRSDRGPDPEVAERFIREARTASRLSHANSVAVYDFGEDGGGNLYLAMELIEGPTLTETLLARGRLTFRESCFLMGQILAALAAAHDAGILHRDIKPSNIMLLEAQDDDGRPTTLVKVCDFGLAKFADSSETIANAQGERRLIGTPLYMSPEQAVSQDVDERSDLYSCGCVFFEMLTGRPPFEADRAVSVLMKHCAAPVPKPSSLVADLPPEIDQVVGRALEKEKEARFDHARAFRSAVLELIRIPDPVPAPSTSDTATHYFMKRSSAITQDRIQAPASSPKVSSPKVEPVPSSAPQELPLESPVDDSGAPAVPEAPEAPGWPKSDMTLDMRIDASIDSDPDFSELLPHMRLPENRVRFTDDARFLWERYGLSPHRRPPPRGFWLLDAKSNRVGPLTFDELCLALRLEVHDGGLEHSFVAADPKPSSWQPALHFLDTVGARSVARIRPPPATSSDTYRGNLDRLVIPSILVRASDAEMTGRVIVSSANAARPTFFEVHVISGYPTHVETNDRALQLANVLVARGTLDEHDLPLLVSDAWTHGSDLATAARRLAGVELSEHRTAVMRRRLRGLLKVSSGSFVLDSSFSPEPRRPFADAFPAILPRLVRDALPPERIEEALGPHLQASLAHLPRVGEMVDRLGFTSSERTMAEELLAAEPLSSALPERAELRRTYSAVAYVLLSTSRSLHPPS